MIFMKIPRVSIKPSQKSQLMHSHGLGRQKLHGLRKNGSDSHSGTSKVIVTIDVDRENLNVVEEKIWDAA